MFDTAFPFLSFEAHTQHIIPHLSNGEHYHAPQYLFILL